MIAQEQVDQIRELHAQGYSKQYIGRKVGVSQPTVSLYIADSTRCGASSKTKYEVIKSKLDYADRDAIANAFAAAKGNMALLSRMINDFPERFGLPKSFTVSDRAVRNFIHSNLPKPTKVVPPPAHFESAIGHQLQIDFTHAEFQFAQNIKPRKIFVFEAAYSWSHMPFLMACPDMTQASWLRGIASCLFKYGVPKEILCDNDKGLVKNHPKNGKPIFNTEFSWFCKNLDITPRACRPGRPQTKGIVERLGEHLKTHGLLWVDWAFKGRINTIEELNEALNYWVDNYDIKQRKFTEYIDGVKHTGTIKELYAQERQYLWLIKPDAQIFVKFQNMTVNKRAQLTVHGYTISLPHVYAGSDVFISICAKGNYIITNAASKIIYQGQIPYANLCEYRFDNKNYDARSTEAPLQAASTSSQEEPRGGYTIVDATTGHPIEPRLGLSNSKCTDAETTTSLSPSNKMKEATAVDADASSVQATIVREQSVSQEASRESNADSETVVASPSIYTRKVPINTPQSARVDTSHTLERSATESKPLNAAKTQKETSHEAVTTKPNRTRSTKQPKSTMYTIDLSLLAAESKETSDSSKEENLGVRILL